MAVSTQIPKLAVNLTQMQLMSRSLDLYLNSRSVISYFIIGIYWISYHKVFNPNNVTVTFLRIKPTFFASCICSFFDTFDVVLVYSIVLILILKNLTKLKITPIALIDLWIL